MNKQNVVAHFFVRFGNHNFTVNRGTNISYGTSTENLPHNLNVECWSFSETQGFTRGMGTGRKGRDATRKERLIAGWGWSFLVSVFNSTQFPLSTHFIGSIVSGNVRSVFPDRSFQRNKWKLIQSTLALRTPRYYEHSLLRTKFRYPSIEVLLKMTPGIRDSRYSGHKTTSRRCPLCITRADCT